MSKGYSSEDAEERIQRAREARQREAEEEAALERMLAALRTKAPAAAPPAREVDEMGASRKDP